MADMLRRVANTDAAQHAGGHTLHPAMGAIGIFCMCKTSQVITQYIIRHKDTYFMGMYIKKNGSLGQIVGAATWQCQWLLQYYPGMKTAIFMCNSFN